MFPFRIYKRPEGDDCRVLGWVLPDPFEVVELDGHWDRDLAGMAPVKLLYPF